MEDCRVIDRFGIEGGVSVVCAINPATIGKPFQADQQRIPGECRSARNKGELPIAERAERKHLPQALPRGG